MKPASPKRRAITERMKIDALLDMAQNSRESLYAIYCLECLCPILPGERIEWDHRHAFGIGGPHHYHNIRPVHYDCHKKKTRRDIKAQAKAKRIAKGGKKRRGPKMKSAGFSKAKPDKNWKPRVRRLELGE